MMNARLLFGVLLTSGCFSPSHGGSPETESSGGTGGSAGASTTGQGATTEQTSATTEQTSAGATSGPTSAESSSGPASTADTSGETTDAGETTSPAPGCSLELDVVFMVSRGDGMLAAQVRLREAFPTFFDHLQAEADLDLRVMVTDLDRVLGAEQCEDEFCPQNNDASCAPLEPAYPCTHEPTACDALHGASVYYPIGVGAANKDCGFEPFLEDADASALDCALTIGEGTQSIEFGGTLSGLLGPTNAPCNGGFVRDSANLVMIVVTNGDDSSFTDAPQWIAETMEKRAPDSMLIAAMTGDAPKIAAYVTAFPFTMSGDVAAESYETALTDAAALALESFCDR